MDPEIKILNMPKWGEDCKSVLQAVMESDDLVGITDLSHINNQRVITQAIEAFRKIMSRSYEREEKDGVMVYPTFENPLLPGKVPDEILD